MSRRWLGGVGGRRVVAARACLPERQQADDGGGERDRALVRPLRLAVDRRHRLLRLLLDHALAHLVGDPAEEGVAAVENAHGATLLPDPVSRANNKNGPPPPAARGGGPGRVAGGPRAGGAPRGARGPPPGGAPAPAGTFARP